MESQSISLDEPYGKCNSQCIYWKQEQCWRKHQGKKCALRRTLTVALVALMQLCTAAPRLWLAMAMGALELNSAEASWGQFTSTKRLARIDLPFTSGPWEHCGIPSNQERTDLAGIACCSQVTVEALLCLSLQTFDSLISALFQPNGDWF